MNSQELQQAQDTIESLIINEVKQPLKDFAKIRKYLDLLEVIHEKILTASEEKLGIKKRLECMITWLTISPFNRSK